MAKFRVNKTAGFTVMSNHHLRDKNLTLKAKGLLSMMLSLPENWDYSIGGLVAISVEKETAIISALKELKSAGYIQVTKIPPSQTKSGRFEYVYDIFEQPRGNKSKNQPPEKQDLEILGVENLGLEFLGVENQGLNKDTDKQNKDNKININNNRSYQGRTPEPPDDLRSEKNDPFAKAHELCKSLGLPVYD